MSSVAGLSRNAAQALVEREERRTGSRMVAYEIVAQTVGTSAEWLRKFIQRTEGKEPKLTVGFNILTLYSQVCDRVEQHRDNERKLKREIDAAIESIVRVVDGVAGSQSGGTDTQDNAKTPAAQRKVK